MKTRSQTRNESVEVDREVIAPGSSHTSYVGRCIQSLLNEERIKRIPHVRTRKTNLGCLRYDQQGQQLLPGIPNEVTLDLIAPKLPWRTFHILSSVSSGWLGAVRSRQVYDARIRSHSTETLVLINYIGFDHRRRIGVFSLRDRKFHLLPGIPHYALGIPRSCQCVSVKGKVYVLGGMSSDDTGCSSKVYVMDLAGKGHWEPCASMKYKSSNFGCVVLDGKIYTCRGVSMDSSCVSEVYDPELDIWSAMKSTIAPTYFKQVFPLGDEILVYDLVNRIHHFLEIYNPILDEWRKVDMPVDNYWKVLFTAQGKVYSMEKQRVQVYDFDKRSWTHQHSFPLPAPLELEFGSPLVVDNLIHSFPLPAPLELEFGSPLVVDNEIVSIRRGCSGTDLFLESVGFGSKIERIAWRTTECPFPVPFPPSMCVVHL